MRVEQQMQLHAFVEGRVQGVGFRFFVMGKAESLKLTGWVRNTYDDKVELAAEGSRRDLERLLEEIRIGPRSAVVLNVSQEWKEAEGTHDKFIVLPSSLGPVTQFHQKASSPAAMERGE